MDGGANICLTGDLTSLVSVVDIPPMPITVAVAGSEVTLDDCCTRQGFIPLVCTDGSIYWQLCFYCANAVETIISPQAVLASSDIFHTWLQTGFKDGRAGSIRFDSADGLLSMHLSLDYFEGLYYCSTDVITVDPAAPTPDPAKMFRIATTDPISTIRRPSRYIPVSKSKQLESELWLLRLGSPGVTQLDRLPGNVTGIPSEFDHHPFRFVDFKAQARIRKQAAQRTAVRTSDRRRRYYMDYGFMRASTPTFGKRNKATDRVVFSYDGYSSYLLIVDEASRYIWVFLTSSKDPPLDIVTSFLTHHGHPDGGCIRTDQGGELARSFEFQDTVLRAHHYVVEPTGSDSPSQNGAVEIYNDSFGVKTRTLLYGAGLPAKYWSAALTHAVYLHNRLIHSETRKTPFEGYFGMKPDLSRLKVFGSRVCVKQAGGRAGKLDRNDFTGIFLGYTATDQNILYIDLTSGIVKTNHHADFDEAWYLQPSRPPAAQLLYDLGLEPDAPPDEEPIAPLPTETTTVLTPANFESLQYTTWHPPMIWRQQPINLVTTNIPWPPMKPFNKLSRWMVPPACRVSPLPLRETAIPTNADSRFRPSAAAAAMTLAPPSHPSDHALFLHPFSAKRTKAELASELVSEYLISHKDISPIYMSPCPYFDAFEEELDLRKFDLNKHRTAGLCLTCINGRLILGGMTPSTPAAKIARWRTRLKGAWLIKIGDTEVNTIEDAQRAFATLSLTGSRLVVLLFSHPEIRPSLTHDGLPIVSSAPFHQQVHDQMNKRWDFDTVAAHLLKAPPYQLIPDGDVVNCVTKAMKLTRGKLLQMQDWNDWLESEYLQLNQYHRQGMFGDPVAPKDGDAIFHLVWTYTIKAVDGRKKARCVCDGSTRSGQVRVLAETYANCVEQTSARLFYAVSAAENMLVFGADVSNAFAEAPPPKQPFFIRPDRAFNEWWTNHLKRPAIPAGHIIPVLKAMQGHPESPRLWEKHADKILRELGLVPTVHEPCLYSGTFNGKRILFLRQVDDFAIAAPDAKTSDMLMDLIDDKLSEPIKRQGYLDLYNGVDIVQTRHYIKLTVKTFVEKAFSKHIETWMKTSYPTPNRSTPLPPNEEWLKKFNSAVGNPDPKAQAALQRQMQLSYRSGVGELIWAMTTCRPDLAYTSVKLSQSNTCPADDHYHGLKHALKFLYNSRDDGLFFWRPTPRLELPEGPLPVINSTLADLRLDGRPEFPPLIAHAYADSDWATCPKTRRSFGGVCIRLAGGTIAYKCRFQPTIAGSSTEAEFMAACDTGRTILYIRSILWDLDIPQEAATLLYEDNDGCTAMGNAQKPTTRTRHIDIKFFTLCDWVERDLMLLDRIDTSINMADHLTKALQPTLFHRHADFLLGHVPPNYSPVHSSTLGASPNLMPDIDLFVPTTYTTPITARAARVYCPLKSDYSGSPWLSIICMGLTIRYFMSST